MQSAAETVENASILSGGSAQDGHRLWIGNIDPKITEYHLVKLLEKFGQVKQFDFLFHKSGPLEGQPRGYCFVNFHTKEEAERAIQCLNGKLALSKKLVVRWAHAQKFEPFRGDKNLPASLEPSSSEADELPTTLRFGTLPLENSVAFRFLQCFEFLLFTFLSVFVFVLNHSLSIDESDPFGLNKKVNALFFSLDSLSSTV
uniref:Probable RNA-binding protein 18 n=1 Tax=Cyprinus carpio TaxID=7962 RepID=A0A8C2G3Q0_CYPCA